MPNLTFAVPKYRKHRASGQAVVTIGGRDQYLGPHGSQVSRDQYDRVIAEYLAAGRNPVIACPLPCISLGQLLQSFWRSIQTYYVKNGQPTSEMSSHKQVIRTARRLYGNEPAVEFGPLALKAVRQVWLDEGLARSTINRNQRRLVRIFKWAVSEQLLGPEVWQSLKAVEGLKKGRTDAPESKPVPPVDIAVVQATMPHLSPVVQDMIRMQLLTGMRPGEVCMLRPCDVDRGPEVWEFRPDGHKTEHHGRDRIVYIGPQAKVILSPYLLRNATAHCFSASESREWFRAERSSQRITPASCGNAKGRRGRRGQNAVKPRPSSRTRKPRSYFDTSGYGQAIGYGCQKAWPAPEEIKVDEAAVKKWHDDHKWTPNQIRHTRATEIRRQFGLEAAQVILGHATADVTQIYAERDAERARDVVRQIG